MTDLHDCYRILDLEPGASLADINQAYKDLVFVWHPDRIPLENTRLHQKALEKIKAINHARDTLRHHRHREAAAPAPTATPYSARATTPPQRPPTPAPHQRSNAGDRPAAEPQHHNYQAKTYPRSYKTQPQTQAPWDTGWEYKSASESSYTPPPHYWAQTQSYSGSSPAGRSSPYPGARDLDHVDLRGAHLQERDLSGRDLSGRDLSGADLSDAFLHKINLSQANLSAARLFRANLLQANLQGANLRDANLMGADLSGADLSDADLTGAQVGVGNKIMVKLTGTRLRGTIMPDGTKHA